jgi:glutaredoxin
MDFEKPSATGYTIYSKSRCPFCRKAKVLLEEEPYTIIDCDQYLADDTTKQDFLQFIENLINKEYRTFPMIFKDGQFIGGFNETKIYYDKEQAFNSDF